MSKRHTFILVLIALAATGCGKRDFDMQPVPRGYVATPEVRIEAEDGSFTIQSGERFDPPFSINTFELRAAVWDAETLAHKSLDAQTIGAERVRVHVPGREEPLYGVLMLSEAPKEAVGAPAWRSYMIQIPQKYIYAAEEGVSFVYEMGKIGEQNAKVRRAQGAMGERPESHGDQWFSWILWMSNAPFDQLPDRVEAMSPKQREQYAFDEGDVDGPYDVPMSAERKQTMITTFSILLSSLLLLPALAAGGG